MTKQKILNDLSSKDFFGGFIVPIGSNPQVTVGTTVLDKISSPSKDVVVYRAYYNDIQGNTATQASVDLYVINDGLDNEAAYYSGQEPISRVQSPAVAAAIQAAIQSAKTTG